ncbi:hypothetical protein WOLCODRAFT_144498 [Wolfiporia cocos MD-104 SS10]|uniref:Uncharacterized protein n=1 Tax=Wolfiporia cocos (strain MD-104) TaxID=742152 RepID=A0A2H3JPM3_WOLCO|nr:hypothetical protein WOLCODRAFT_144498 [Wolfiporia cocos MD-104 SS10]
MWTSLPRLVDVDSHFFMQLKLQSTSASNAYRCFHRSTAAELLRGCVDIYQPTQVYMILIGKAYSLLLWLIALLSSDLTAIPWDAMRLRSESAAANCPGKCDPLLELNDLYRRANISIAPASYVSIPHSMSYLIRLLLQTRPLDNSIVARLRMSTSGATALLGRSSAEYAHEATGVSTGYATTGQPWIPTQHMFYIGGILVFMNRPIAYTREPGVSNAPHYAINNLAPLLLIPTEVYVFAMPSGVLRSGRASQHRGAHPDLLLSRRPYVEDLQPNGSIAASVHGSIKACHFEQYALGNMLARQYEDFGRRQQVIQWSGLARVDLLAHFCGHTEDPHTASSMNVCLVCIFLAVQRLGTSR